MESWLLCSVTPPLIVQELNGALRLGSSLPFLGERHSFDTTQEGMCLTACVSSRTLLATHTFFMKHL